MRGLDDRARLPVLRRARWAVRITSTLLALAVLSAGCGQIPDGDDASVTPPPAGPPVGDGSVENPSADPSSGQEDSSFSFDDIASYEGGVEIEIAGAVAQQATSGMTGAEATKGQMVVVSVLLRNGSGTAVDATTVLVTTTYGADGSEAPLVVDPTGGLANGFLGPVTAGQEATAEYGFAVPFSALGRVTVTVDLGDGEHEPVSFTGVVERGG